MKQPLNNQAKTDTRHQIVIVGGGLTGLTAALAAGLSGFNVGLIRQKAAHDPRTTALMLGAVNMLKALDIWPLVQDCATPLEHLKIVDITGRLIRSPTALFRASEIDCPAFAYNIANETLLQTLETRIAACTSVTVYNSLVTHIVHETSYVVFSLDDQRSVLGQLGVGADGRSSLVRSSMGLKWHQTDYPQVALACHLAHKASHNYTSLEFHTHEGPCTFVPRQGRESALVWAMKPETAETFKDLDDETLIARLNTLTRGHLSVTGLTSTRGFFPITLGYAESIAADRVVLIGEAAHVLPPIGAQGLNLGFRDIASLIDCLIDFSDSDPGAKTVTSAYKEARKHDMTSRRLIADALNKTLISDALPAQLARFVGLHLLTSISSLRRRIMHEGMAPKQTSNRLLQAELPVWHQKDI